MQLSFGSGAIWGERTDVIGSGIGPRQFGVLQDIQIDFDWSDKTHKWLRSKSICLRSAECRGPIDTSVLDSHAH